MAYASDRSGEGNLDVWVQQVVGGEPIRLTRDPADDDEPAFSPEGSKIAFHSERDGGGIYIVSALGGEARLIARQGRRPRFSPDGRQIAYWVGAARWSPAAPGAGRIFVVSADGGLPRRLQPEFGAARLPVWAPDGKRLLFLGLRDPKGSIEQSYDWWIAPVEGGAAIKTGAYDAFRKHFRVPWEGDPPTFTPSMWTSDPDQVIFAGPSGATRNLWQIGLSSRSGKVTGAPQQLTFGTAAEVEPSAAPGPSGQTRVVFASLLENFDVRGLGLNANEGRVTGQLQPLTQGSDGGWLSVSPDGNRLLFVSLEFRSGNTDIWLKDLETGKSVALTSTPASEDYPAIAPDGSRAAYWILAAEKAAIYVIDTRGGVPEKVCEDCGAPWDWSSDGRKVPYYWANRRRLGLLDVASGEKIELLKHPNYILAQPRFSPDGRWISFVARTGANRARVGVAPFRQGITPESDWISVTDDAAWVTSPCWSPMETASILSPSVMAFVASGSSASNPPPGAPSDHRLRSITSTTQEASSEPWPWRKTNSPSPSRRQPATSGWPTSTADGKAASRLAHNGSPRPGAHKPHNPPPISPIYPLAPTSHTTHRPSRPSTPWRPLSAIFVLTDFSQFEVHHVGPFQMGDNQAQESRHRRQARQLVHAAD